MTCPFLREAQVRYCRAATVRKLIPTTKSGHAGEKCSSAAHTSCAVYQKQIVEEPLPGPCPFFGESLMQYCNAAPVTRFVPYSESLISRCGNDSFRYCELYLEMAHPASAVAEVQPEEIDGIAMPESLAYSSNHMWLEVTGDGTCHAGIDAFLSRALGSVERISYVWLAGEHRPTAVITAGGTDLEVVFPNPFLLTKCNLYLRADPSRITAEPYTGGWLFEGIPDPETSRGLLTGSQAREWMEDEQRRMNQYLQEQQSPQDECRLAADGGLFAEGVALSLDRDHRLGLFHEFFSPFASGKKAL